MLILPKIQYLRESYSSMSNHSALAQRLIVAGFLLSAGLVAYPLAAGRQQPSSATPATAVTPQVDPKAVIDKYCVSCHSERLKQAGLVLEKRDYTKIAD